MKKFFSVPIIILALTTAILLVCVGVSADRSAKLKDYAAVTIFYALHDLDERLDWMASSGEYTSRSSQTIQRALSDIETACEAAEKLYASSVLTSNRSLTYLADLLGCSYAGKLNSVPFESILFDGEVSENELVFLTALCADVNALLAPMLAEDELNMRDDLTYSEIREPLAAFAEKWSDWTWKSDAPYDLLSPES